MSIVQDLGSDTTDISGEVALTWSDLRSDETGYQVQYRLTPSGPWSNGLTFAAGSTGGTQTGLEASTSITSKSKLWCLVLALMGSTVVGPMHMRSGIRSDRRNWRLT